MKLLHSPVHDFRTEIPVGGFSLIFECFGHRCAVPNWAVEQVLLYNPQMDVIRDFDVNPPKSMLISRGGGLGDILLCTPLIRWLAKQGTLVDFEADIRNLGVLEHNPWINKLWHLGDRAPRDPAIYDAIVNLAWFVEHLDNVGHRMHRACGFAHYCDVPLNPKRLSDIHLDLTITDDERQWASGLLNATQDGDKVKWVSYVVGTADSPAREWRPDTHKAVLDAILNAGYHVVVLGANPIPEFWHKTCMPKGLLDMCCQTTIRQMAAIIAVSDVLICPDTGAFHIGQALGKPILSPFGPFPLKERQTAPGVVQVGSPMDCPRVPCRSYRCWLNGGAAESPCLSTTPERVVAELERIM